MVPSAPSRHVVGRRDACDVDEATAHEEVGARDGEGWSVVGERPVAGAVRAQGGPGAAVPPGDVVGPREACGVGEGPAHVEVAAGDRQGADVVGERPVAGAVRAQGGPGAAVPPGDVVGPRDACGVDEATAHVEVRCPRPRGRRRRR